MLPFVRIFVPTLLFFLSSCSDNPKVISANETGKPQSQSGIFVESQKSGSASSASPTKLQAFSDGVHTVVVNEVLPTSKYVYLHVTEGVQQYWLATRKQEVKIGGIYYYRDGLLKTNFESKEYNRVFDRMVLVSKLVAQHHGGQTGVASPSLEESSNSSSNSSGNPAATVLSIAELVSNPQKFAGKVVQLRGKCVKVNPNIMDRNWIHLQDGSRDDYDLVITSAAHVHEGDQLTMQASVSLDRDFGAGYSYELILENGVVVKE